MPAESGEPQRKLPERSDALRIDLEFDIAVKAALETRPPPSAQSRKRVRKKPKKS